MAGCGFWQHSAAEGSVSASQVHSLGYNPELKISWSYTSNEKDVFEEEKHSGFFCSKTSLCPQLIQISHGHLLKVAV